MFKSTRNVYVIKTTPYNDNEKLENLLNDMSKNGWDLYSMQEIENDDDVFYNCIFIKEVENEDEFIDDGLSEFKPRIERIINPELEPYELCLDILKKINDKRQKIAQVKALIDGTSEDSRSVLNEEISKHIKDLEELKSNLSKVINPNIMEKKLTEAKLTIALSEELTEILDTKNEDNLLAQIVLLRQNLTETLGYILPKIKIEIDETLQENEFSIKLRGIPVVNSYAYINHSMFIENELKIEELPENSIKSFDKVLKTDTVWIDDETAKDFWTKGLSVTDYIGNLIEHTLIKYIEDIFDYSDINRYMEIVGNQNLYLVENIIPDVISIPELKYLLANLIKERISIRDITFIFEKLNDIAGDNTEEDLLAKMRIALSRQICASVCDENNIIHAYELSDSTLELLSLSPDKEDGIIRVQNSKVESIIKKIKSKVKKSEYKSKDILLIVPMEIRHAIYLVLSRIMPNIKVMAIEELSEEYHLLIVNEI